MLAMRRLGRFIRAHWFLTLYAVSMLCVIGSGDGVLPAVGHAVTTVLTTPLWSEPEPLTIPMVCQAQVAEARHFQETSTGFYNTHLLHWDQMVMDCVRARIMTGR
jgi:hypothetical protein